MAENAKEKETKAVAPRRSFMDLGRWERDMERMMEDFFGRRTRPWWPERWFRTEEMEATAPAVDLYEEKDDIVVKAELPGIDKDNIEVSLTDHTITIKGEKKKRGSGQRRELLQIGAFVWALRQDVRAAEGRSYGQGQSQLQKWNFGSQAAQDGGGQG
jgi:HSP20 family molecular chaperone IbpA